MDPTPLIVTALAAGAATGLTDTVSQAVQDAYTGLKGLIARKYAVAAPAVAQLEAAPASKARRAVAEEDLGKTEVARDADVLRQAQALLETVARDAPALARTFGIDVEGVKAGAFKLSDIVAQGAGPVTGVRVKDSEFAGDFSITGVRVTSGPAPASRTEQPAPDPAQPKIKILFLAANPTETTRLRLDEEVRAIDQSLRGAQYRDAFVLEQAHAVHVSDLQGLLLRYDPDIVHFSGHGSPAGEIILEDETGGIRRVSAGALTAVFSLLKGHIRCVVLNACFSQIQAQAIAGHIDCVIGMSTAIGDQAAINFAAAFYQALAYNQDINTAFGLGRNLIDLQGLGEQDTPQLLALKADPAQVKFIRP